MSFSASTESASQNRWPNRLFRSGLAQSRGEVGHSEVGGVNLIHEFAVGLGFFLDTLPFRIVLEGFPVGGGCFAAGMLKNVNQGVAFLGLIERRPVSDAFHSVAVKEFYGVVAEPRLEVRQFSWSCMVDAEFEDGPSCCGVGVRLPSSGPK